MKEKIKLPEPPDGFVVVRGRKPLKEEDIRVFFFREWHKPSDGHYWHEEQNFKDTPIAFRVDNDKCLLHPDELVGCTDPNLLTQSDGNRGHEIKPENPTACEATLRDEFASKAMSSLIIASRRNGPEYADYDPETVAENAYKMADFMLEARAK